MNKTSWVLCGNFISIYKINRTLHGRLGIRILSSRAESISHSFAGFAHSWEILSPLEDKIRIPKRPCNILYLIVREELLNWHRRPEKDKTDNNFKTRNHVGKFISKGWVTKTKSCPRGGKRNQSKQEILFYFIVSNDLMLFRKRLDNVHWADYSSTHDSCLASNFQSD